MELKLLTQDQVGQIVKEALKGHNAMGMHSIGAVTGPAINLAQARLTLKQVIEFIEGPCGEAHHCNLRGVGPKECLACQLEQLRQGSR